MYRLTKDRGMDLKVATAPKSIASRYYQLKSNHAMMGQHLKRIKRVESDRC
jgi:hypothetical protein